MPPMYLQPLNCKPMRKGLPATGPKDVVQAPASAGDLQHVLACVAKQLDEIDASLELALLESHKVVSQTCVEDLACAMLRGPAGRIVAKLRELANVFGKHSVMAQDALEFDTGLLAAGIDYNISVVSPGGETLAVPVQVSWPLSALKRAIEDVSGVPGAEQRLVWGSSELDFEKHGGVQLGNFKPFLEAAVSLTLIRRPAEMLMWLQRVVKDPQAIAGAPDEVKADREIMCKVVRQDGSLLRHASAELRSEGDLVVEALRSDPRSFEHAAASVWSDPAFVLQAVSIDGTLLRLATADLQGDNGIVLRAAQCSGASVFGYAAQQLWESRRFVWHAVGISGDALRYASRELRADVDIVFRASSQDTAAFEHASPEIWTDLSFLLQALRLGAHALKYAPGHLLADPEFMLEAARLNPETLGFASPDLLADEAWMESAREAASPLASHVRPDFCSSVKE